MPSAATSSSSPVLTSHLGQLSSGLGSSLADIYNTRHAQENRILVATHRPHIYPRIVSSESASLAELYNQRYDEEQEQDSSRQACTRAGSGSSSDVPLILRRKSTVNSRSILRPPANPPSGSSSDPIVLERVTPTPVTRPLPPSQASLVISDDDDDDDDDDDREDDREDDPEVDELSAPQQESPRIRHPQNSTAPESSEDDSPQLLSVKLSPGKRVRPPSVNFSSHSLTSRVSDPAEAKTAEAEEEEEDDDNELLEPLARPRPSTRLIVQSSQSQSQPTGTESEPVIAPIRHHADRPTLKPPVLADDEELDAAASEDRELASPANDSSSARSSAPPPNVSRILLYSPSLYGTRMLTSPSPESFCPSPFCRSDTCSDLNRLVLGL